MIHLLLHKLQRQVCLEGEFPGVKEKVGGRGVGRGDAADWTKDP